MSYYEQSPFRGTERSPDECLPAVDLRDLAKNAYSTSLDWGATPLNTYHDPELIKRQEQVRWELELRSLEVPPEVGEIPQDIQDYVAQNFLSRFNGRTMANFDNFSQRLRPNLVEFDMADRMVIEKAVWGQATPAELLYIRGLSGMASVELGCLTHPYGVLTDQDKLDSMRDSVRDAIVMLGGTLAITEDSPEHDPIEEVAEGLDGRDVFAVKQADNLHYSGALIHHLQKALLVTRKRNLGLLPDGTIVRERSSFVVRIDENSEFDQGLAAKMRRVRLTYNDRAMERLAKIGKISEVVPPMIANRQFGTVIPLSTTVYAFNRLTDARIKERDRQLREAELRRRAEGMLLLDAESSEETSGDRARSFGRTICRHLRIKKS